MPLNHFICSCCGKSKPIDQRILLGGDALCHACAEEFTTLCDRCGERCTAERHDKSIITRFVHNAVEKSVRKTDPTESHAFSGILHFKEKIMFENQKFLTSGVQNEIPSWLIDLIWCMVFSMKTEGLFAGVYLNQNANRSAHRPRAGTAAVPL